MPYTPENNPYIPGDPYSYDLKWIVDHIKEALSLYQPLHDEFTEIQTNFDDLYDYVHDYFDNLDVSEELTAILNEWLTNGQFETLVHDIYDDTIDTYLADKTEEIDTLSARVNQLVATNTTNLTGWNVIENWQKVTASSNTITYTWTNIPDDAVVLETSYQRALVGDTDPSGALQWYEDMQVWRSYDNNTIQLQKDSFTASAYAFIKLVYAVPQAVVISELEDIRVDYYGTAYANAGNAVRGSDNYLQDQINSLGSYGAAPLHLPAAFERGGIVATGENQNPGQYNYRVRMVDKFLSPYPLRLTAAAGFRFYTYYYTNYSDTSCASNVSWRTSLTIPANSWFRILIARATENPGELAVPADFAYNITYTYMPLISAQAAQNGTFKAVAHRGYSDIAPENTMPAFKAAKIAGFNMIETDIRFTSDGVAVLLHDATINRTARNMDGTAIGSTININSITYADALNYDFGIWKGAEFAGTTIPTLEDFLKYCKRCNIGCLLELKEGTDAQVISMLALVRSYGMNDSIWFIAASTQLAQLRNNRYNNMGVIANATPTAGNLSYLAVFKDKTKRLGFCISVAGITQAYVNDLISNDYVLATYSVDSSTDGMNLNPYVDFVMSNNINWMREYQDIYR